MNAISLYKLLQQHVGKVNELVVGLYQETLTPEDVELRAKTEVEKVLAELNKGNLFSP